MTYQITKLEQFNDDPILAETLKMVASGQLDPQAGQAATWHITDKMSWEQLAAKSVPHIGRAPTSYFSAETMARAQNIHFTAIARAKEQAEKSAIATTKNGRNTSATVKRD